MSGMGNVYDKYPDDDTVKDVRVYADTNMLEDERHVWVGWFNSTDPIVMQIAHLTGGAGNYSYISPQAKMRHEASVKKDRSWDMGKLTREARDEILASGKEVKFNMKTKVNNCQVWMRELLAILEAKKLITEDQVAIIIKDVPLMEPKESVVEHTHEKVEEHKHEKHHR